MPDPVIFVVDDDAAVRRAVRRLMSSLEYSIRLFASAEQFLSTTDTGTPGCLILDLNLPGMSGLQLQQRLAELAWKVPIIFVTAHADAGSRDAALRGGAVDYMPKPFDCGKLLTAVSRALRSLE